MRRFLSRVLTVFAAVIVCAGCTAVPSFDATALPPIDDESYFIFGAQPDNIEQQFSTGELKDGKMDFDDLVKPNYIALPSKGYIVGMAHGDRMVGAGGFVWKDESGWLFTKVFLPCGNETVLTFKPQPGTVLYFGDLVIEGGRDRLYRKYRDNFAAARAFMRENYPKLADKLQHGTYQLVPAARECPTP